MRLSLITIRIFFWLSVDENHYVENNGSAFLFYSSFAQETCWKRKEGEGLQVKLSNREFDD